MSNSEVAVMSNSQSAPLAARRLAGAVAVVTGSSTGNGRAIALELAAEGAKVVCADVRKDPDPNSEEDRGDRHTDDLIVELGGDARYQRTDVTQADQVDALADLAVAEFGRLDVWVNNAGIADYGPLEIATFEQYRLITEVNSTGTWLGCRAAARVMRTQEPLGRSRGHIVNVGSIEGEVGQGGLGAYAASKGAIHAMTKEFAVELAPHLINVNVIAPGAVTQTAMGAAARQFPEQLEILLRKHPWPELGTPRDLAMAVAFLASDAAAWITGAVLPVDGGYLAT
jgi:NAD(P)-dependent dehydrogenase (short-subunit alcohol dehydrogenase family)